MNGMQTPLIAHRCGRAYGPDSSRRALRAALAGGPLGGVETDVCLTRDGALACLHDPCLAVGTTLTGWAHERSAAELVAGRLLDGGGRASAERPLLVDELFDLIPPRLTVQLDIKAHADEALARRTVDALARVLARRADADRIEVLSFHSTAVERAASRALAARLVVCCDRAPLALARSPRRGFRDIGHRTSDEWRTNERPPPRTRGGARPTAAARRLTVSASRACR